MKTVIYVVHSVWQRLKAYVAGHLPNEAYAVIGCGLSSSVKHCRFLGKALYMPDSADYEVQTPGLVRVKPSWFHAVLRTCARLQHHPVLVHSHVSRTQPCESSMDRISTMAECPTIAAAMPSAAIGEMIVSRDMRGVEAHVFNRLTGRMEPIHVVLAPTLGSAGILFPTSSPLRSQWDTTEELLWSRLQLAFGPEATKIMKSFHFGLVGASSLGEPVAAMLSNLGAELTLVDTDTFQDENVKRSIFGSRSDAAKNIKKVHLVRRGCQRSTPEARIHTVVGDIRDESTQKRLIHCDGLVLLTDNVASRIVGSHLAMTHGLMMFDVGTGIDVKDGTLQSVRGQVMKLIPGLNLCHECAKFFDLREGRIELRSEDDYELARRRGYVTGASIPAPSVMPVNMQLAGACVWEILRYFCGATPDIHTDILALELINNTMRAHVYERNADGQRVECATCSPGMLFMCGDQAPLMTRALRSELSIPRGRAGTRVQKHGAPNSPKP